MSKKVSIYLYLDSQYSLLSINEMCSEKGMISLDNINDCKKAARTLGIKKDQWMKEFVDPGLPKGCIYPYMDYDGKNKSFDVGFNSHPNGLPRQKESAPICQNG